MAEEVSNAEAEKQKWKQQQIADNHKKQARKNRSRFVIGEESEEEKKKIVQFLKPQDFGEIDMSLEYNEDEEDSFDDLEVKVGSTRKREKKVKDKKQRCSKSGVSQEIAKATMEALRKLRIRGSYECG